RRPGARRGPAPAGRPPARCRPCVRGRGAARGPARRAPAVRRVAGRGPGRAPAAGVRGRAPRGAGRVRGRAAARERRAGRARGGLDRRERDPGWRRLRPVRHRLRGAAAPAGGLGGRDAPHHVSRHRRRPLRVARGSSRPAAPLMPPPPPPPPPLLDGLDFAALADALAALGADAWLLYDFRHVNPVAERILGPTGMSTRRLFVLLPRSGKPVAVAHRIELQPLAEFPGEVRPYGSWRELHGELQALARGRTLAMEVSAQDAVPYLDRVPHGVVQLLESFGAHVVSSAPLVTRFAARWSAAEREGHRRAAEALASIAADALAWAGSETARGAEVRGARDAAVTLLRERWQAGAAVSGAEVDDAARAVIRGAGLAEYFVHRTGHSIDRDLHGSGPHIDNFETADSRALVSGVGFSVEPGVYLPGRFGVRSE